MDAGLTNKAWDEYDTLIRDEVAGHNKRHGIAVDWKFFRAVLWVESGGPANPAWNTRPMQIGNPGDKGYGVLKRGEEAAPAVMSDALKEDIRTGNISTPRLNVRAGIAYALTRHATSHIASVDDPRDTMVREHTVKAGNTLSGIAAAVGSTVPSLQKLNPAAQLLKPGQKIRYRKARMARVITGWLPVSAASLASRYNSGDPAYATKLEYVLALFPRLQR